MFLREQEVVEESLRYVQVILSQFLLKLMMKVDIFLPQLSSPMIELLTLPISTHRTITLCPINSFPESLVTGIVFALIPWH